MSSQKLQKRIAVYSEKGGVGKTTILSSIANKIVNVESAVFLDADSSSQSLSDVLKFYNLYPKIVYRDNICVLPFLLEIHQSTEYFFIDLAGYEATIAEIDYFKYMDLVIIPIPPIYSNYSTPVHTVDKLIKNGLDGNKILITINYMWSNEHLDNKVVDEFILCIDAIKQKFNVHVFKSGIAFGGNVNRNADCLKTNSKFNQDIIKLAEMVKSIVNHEYK